MSDVTITGVKPGEINAMWPFMGGFFSEFEKRGGGEARAGDLLYQVIQGTRQCWIAIVDGEIKACALTEVLDPPFLTVQLNYCVGKDRHEWRDAMVQEIEAWAQHMGSKRVRIVCRPGWAREIEGYRETHRVVEKDIG